MRDISQLHPVLQEKLRQVEKACGERGLPIGIGECIRTVEEQNELYAQGRTKPGQIVTNAKGTSYSSMHQWGVAFDFYRKDGKGAYEDGDGFFGKVGAIGKEFGLEWGGDWKSITDKPHFQLPDWGSTPKELKKQYKTPQAFMQTWPAGGWQFDGTGWLHRRTDGLYTRNDWEKIDGYWYWFDGAGHAVEENWYSYKGKWYYLGRGGKMVTGLQIIGEKVYYFYEDGIMAEETVTLTPGEDGSLR